MPCLPLYSGSISAVTQHTAADKPHGANAAFGAAMRFFGVENPQQVVSVGDSIKADIMPPFRMGMRTMFVGKELSWRERGFVDAHVQTPEHLARCLLAGIAQANGGSANFA